MNDLFYEPDAGAMNNRLQLERLTELPDGQGGTEDDWAVVGTYWASVTPLRGSQLLAARQLKAAVWHRIETRDIGPILPSDRFRFKGTTRVVYVESTYRRGEQSAALVTLGTEGVAEQLPAS